MIDVKQLIETGMQLANVRKDHDGIPFIVTPKDTTMQSLEALLPAPTAIRSTVILDDVLSFARYVNEFKNENTKIFAQQSDLTATFRAVIDYSGKDNPSWCNHKATYACPQSKEWKAWNFHNGTKLSQKDFAEFLEDNLIDIVNPSGAEVLEVAKSLVSKNTVNFKSGIRLDNGNEQLVYEETSEAKAGAKGELEIPTGFTLGIAPFKGGPSYRIEARLKYRIDSGRLLFFYELIKPHCVIADACAEIIAKINLETGIAPLAGFIN